MESGFSIKKLAIFQIQDMVLTGLECVVELNLISQVGPTS